MPSHIAAIRRINVLLRTLSYGNKGFQPINIRTCSTSPKIGIGDVEKDIKIANHPEYVPKKYYTQNLSQSSLHHLKWMMQKDILGQDMFLIGPPGPRKRLLALQYLELTDRELEYVALNRDTTEADLKQRREIVSGTAKYFDQSAVRAAVHGRILILEGIEKAERNVLPVLNNLLENREMHLEDGRLLIPASRYDQLLKEHSKEELEKWKIVRVSEDFRVIALGLPVPKYVGNPLDPPLRSRFQARDVCNTSYQEYLLEMRKVAPNVPVQNLEHVLSGAFGLLSPEGLALGLPDFPVDNLVQAAKVMDQNNTLSTHDILYRLYPYKIFMKDGIQNVKSLLNNLKIYPSDNPEKSFLNYEQIASKLSSFLSSKKPPTNESGYIETNYQNNLINDMLQTYSVNDLCLIGPRGCGKNIVVNKLAEMVGQNVESIVLYQDMTSRDLIQQRTTLDNGDTVWRNSPLINAALEGKIALIDGIHRIHPSTLSVLHRLVHDRELQLHDGKRLISSDRYEYLIQNCNLTKEQLTKSGVFPIHPNFRIIGLAEPPLLTAKTNWLTAEMLSLFLFHEMRTLNKIEEMGIITAQCGPISKSLHQLIDLAHVLRNSPDPTLQNLAGHLSTRQLIRIATRMAKYPTDNVYEVIQATFMSKFLPSLTKEALENTVKKLGIKPMNVQNLNINYKTENDVVTIGNTSIPLYNTKALSKVPNILFYDVPQHLLLMEKLLQDFQLGSHLLLVGNQGVGKNKIVDRFLQLLNRPREYIQLHRDTTVQTLTTQPTVKNGLLIHEDSPLVKAIKLGHILVIDEADKAPTHVTCILKTLVESGEMILSDGRRIVRPSHVEHYNPSNTIITHPDFRMIILANRPGFPFLGNDFFGALGDLFSCHAVDNPTEDAEIQLLKQYGPHVSEVAIRKLVSIFDDLRTLADQGLVNYPYSTREVVNIVKHLEQFPNAEISEVIFNVFDFDKYSNDVVQTLAEVLTKHGFQAQNLLNAEWLAAKRAKEYLQVTENRKSGLDTKGPKHGKEDPNNDPHIGGNTWAGGTGGRDTAGLGGKGGPYRLDKGHKVHQLSDEEKNAVPDHIKAAAREMGRKAFEEKLKEIGMSGYDASIYNQYSNSVQREVQSLRVILGSLQAKNKERHWSRHQTSGELDDVKLIDGLLGEKTVYRRRTEQEPELGTPQLKPKRLRLVVDVSGSMYRFNSYDGRLDRELEAVVLVMEAFQGFEDKIKYDIMGHSGDAHEIKFIGMDDPPDNNMKRLEIMRLMHAHSQYCWTGDNTLEATELAIESLAKEDSDEAIVVVLSDANLQRYGIPPQKLGNVLTAHPNVSAYAVFIGSLGDQAERLTQNLPSGRAFVCTDVSNLPQILKQIFSASVMNIS